MAGRPQKAFYDAVMVGLSRHFNAAPILVDRRVEVVEQTKLLFIKHEKGTFTGRGNSKSDVQNRIDLFSNMLDQFL